MPAQILTLTAPDQPGIVARVAQTIADHDGNVTEAAQYNDPASDRFFMRVAFEIADPAALRAAFEAPARDLALDWTLRDADQKAKLLILVSKFDHCLADLLYRVTIGELNAEIVAVAGNHPQEALSVPLPASIPYHHLPITAATKPQQEAQIRALAEETGAELVVLARYMQILSDEMSAWASGRCINIHHSFLPGFKGAKPYHQAYDRGVKIIGATAHYVTEDLDEGPIIAQDVEPITHADQPDDLVRKGRDIERRVLARAVAAHVEGRVFLNGRSTVVFPA